MSAKSDIIKVTPSEFIGVGNMKKPLPATAICVGIVMAMASFGAGSIENM